MAISDKLRERASEGQALATRCFSMEGGKAVTTFDLQVSQDEHGNLNPQDVHDAVTYILGTTQITTAGLRLNRTPSLAHPQFPFLVASSISAIKGRGEYHIVNAEDILDIPPCKQFALYQHYELTVEFTPRVYAITPNDAISQNLTRQWYNDNGNPRTYTYCEEWLRYTDYDYQPKCSSVTSDQSLRLTWYAVPYRLVTSNNSYLTRWLGRANYNDWYNWKAGQLLYVSFSLKRYTPPIQQQTFSPETLCNIEFNFVHIARRTNETSLQHFPMELLFCDPDGAGAFNPDL